jgi:ABC-type transport system substrate-binding protein
MAAGALGLTGLAGCQDGDDTPTPGDTATPTDDDGGLPGGGDGDGDGDGGETATDEPTETPPSDDVDQELRLPTPNNPEEMNFAFQIGNGVSSQYSAPGDVYAATMEPGLWGRFYDSLYWANDVDIVHEHLYEDITINDFEIEVTIRDDATWSDGEPVRAKDAVGNHAIWKEAPAWEPAPTETRFHIGALGRYEMPDGPDGKTYRFMPPDTQAWEDFGGFAPYGEGEIMARLGGTGGVYMMRAGPAFPTHLDTYEPLVDRAIELWDNQSTEYEGTLVQVLAEDMGWDEGIHEYSRDPENIVTTGPWTVSELRGAQEVVLEPNEHSRLSDEINYNQVVFEYTEEPARERAGIQAERLDYSAISASPSEMDSMPDKYEQALSPSRAGYAFGIDHRGGESFFGDRRVRQAILYALDKEAIAGNIHPNTTRAVTRPGYDMWGTDSLFGGDWAEENLIDYSYDPDKAEELMQEAGFEMQNDVWHRDGEPFEFVVASSRDTPAMETTAISQLEDFGISLELQTLDQSQFIERVRGSNENTYIEEEWGGSGDFRIWSGPTAYTVSDRTAGYFRQLWHWWWWGVANARRTRRFNFFSHEQQEEGIDQYASNGWVRGDYSLWEDWNIEMPSEFGDPDSELEEFNPGFTWGQVRSGPYTFVDPQENNDLYDPPDGGSLEYYAKKFAWLHNWFVPVLPVVMEQNQHFINTGNWNWPQNSDMWQYWGMGWQADELAGMDRIYADPENPK